MSKKKSATISVLLIHFFTAILPILVVTVAFFTQSANMRLFILFGCILAVAGIVLQYFFSAKKTKRES